MIRNRPAFALIVLLGFALAFSCLFHLQDKIDEARSDLHLAGDMSARDRLVELGSSVMLGGFKTVLVNSLWYRADILKQQREWAELEGVIRFIAKVQPTDVAMYDHYIWHMAYNVQFDAPTVVEAWKWVRRAIEFGERGAKRNPNHPEIWKLYWQIGWTYMHRCGEVPGERTEYFAQQVIEEHGKSPYLVAADWFEKAWIAATETPGAKSPNVHSLAMWALAYDRYAEQLAKKGDIDGMLKYRREAIDVHKRIIAKLPEDKKYGYQQVDRLTAFIKLYEKWQAAEKLQKSGDIRGELSARIGLANDWTRILKRSPVFSDPRKPIHNAPAVKEILRNIDRAANDIERLAGRIVIPAEREPVLRRAMGMRYLAADPRRRDAEAAATLRKSVRHFDKGLDGLQTNKELLANAELIAATSTVWTRIAINSPDDEALLTSAVRAVTRYDDLYDAFPDAQKAKHLGPLCDHWYQLLWATDIDSKLARLRVKTAAREFEDALLQGCQAIDSHLRHIAGLIRTHAPIEERQALFGRIAGITPQVHILTAAATKYWFALLRKDAAFRADSKVAEKRLRAIAEALDKTVEDTAKIRGAAKNVRQKADPRSLHTPALAIWRMLDQFSPGNALYSTKATYVPKPKKTGPIDIHDVEGDDGHGHEH